MSAALASARAQAGGAVNIQGLLLLVLMHGFRVDDMRGRRPHAASAGEAAIRAARAVRCIIREDALHFFRAGPASREQVVSCNEAGPQRRVLPASMCQPVRIGKFTSRSRGKNNRAQARRMQHNICSI